MQKIAKFLPSEDPRATLPASFPMGRRWYVVRTNIKCEERAELGLKALHFSPDVYIPKERKTVIRHRRKVDVETAVFGRYVFVQFDINAEPWGAIKHVDGVELLVVNNNVPSAVPDAVIERLRIAEGLGLFDDKTRRASRTIVEGELVEIEEGPFAGFVGKALKLRSQGRVEMLLNLLGTERTFQIPLQNLRVAS
jgi:transcription antitermination factor NusG